MNIAALVTEAYGGFGGIALYNRYLLNALAAQDDVTAVDILPRLIRDRDAASREIGSQALHLYSNSSRSRAFLAGLIRMLSNRKRYDLIVCGHINLLPAAQLVKVRHKAPILLFIHGIDAWQPTTRRYTNSLCRGVDGVVSVSDFTRQKFLGWSRVPRDKTYVLPNALQSELYGVGEKPDYLVRRYGLAGCKVLLTVGRLNGAERYKGIDEVIDLLPRLLEHDPRIKYLVVGDGDDRARLMNRARHGGVHDTVIFAGNVPEGEKADHYRVADVFAMVGRGEGFGFVYLEAMACGIPVLASKRDGSREAVRNGRLGLLADPDDPRELENQIIASLSRPREIPDGLDYFHYPRFVERLNDLLGNIQNQRAASA